jgi:hypothetical protein
MAKKQNRKVGKGDDEAEEDFLNEEYLSMQLQDEERELEQQVLELQKAQKDLDKKNKAQIIRKFVQKMNKIEEKEKQVPGQKKQKKFIKAKLALFEKLINDEIPSIQTNYRNYRLPPQQKALFQLQNDKNFKMVYTLVNRFIKDEDAKENLIDEAEIAYDSSRPVSGNGKLKRGGGRPRKYKGGEDTFTIDQLGNLDKMFLNTTKNVLQNTIGKLPGMDFLEDMAKSAIH